VYYDQDVLKNYGVSNQNQLVMRLNKSLYGLKQAGRLWNQMLNEYLIKVVLPEVSLINAFTTRLFLMVQLLLVCMWTICWSQVRRKHVWMVSLS
jgi:hypothetical protein